MNVFSASISFRPHIARFTPVPSNAEDVRMSRQIAKKMINMILLPR